MKKKHPLRRIMLTTAATVSGVVLLLALKQPADGSATAAAQAPAGSGVPSATASQNVQDAQGGEGTQQDAPSSGPLPTKSSAEASATSGASSGASSGGGSSAPKSVTGDSVDAQYGAVQVKLTVSGGKITKAETLQAPSSGPGGAAVPTLNQEAVAAQSADVDAVSGASYTSEAYKKSLQSAIDKAGL